jgi:hypothetical protein
VYVSLYFKKKTEAFFPTFLVFNLVLHVKISDNGDNYRTATTRYFEGYLEFFAAFQSFCFLFHDFLRSPITFFGTLVFRRTLDGKHCAILLGIVSGLSRLCAL